LDAHRDFCEVAIAGVYPVGGVGAGRRRVAEWWERDPPLVGAGADPPDVLELPALGVAVDTSGEVGDPRCVGLELRVSAS